MSEFDRQRAKAFAGTMTQIMNGGALSLMCSIGHRTGLFDTMSNMESATSDEEETAAEGQALSGNGNDGTLRTLLVVESDVKMQDVLRKLFKKRGYRVLVTGDPKRAMHRLQEDPTAADLAIISSGAIGKPAVEVFNEFAKFRCYVSFIDH